MHADEFDYLDRFPSGRTSADDGHTIMLDLGVEQRKHRVWPVGVVLLRAGTWAGADVGQSLVAVKSW
jgi:hypothetical protein